MTVADKHLHVLARSRGYKVVPDGWVAVTWCSGADQDGCAEVLVNVTVTGDLRAARQAGLL